MNAASIDKNTSWFETRLLDYPVLRVEVDIYVTFQKEICCPVIYLIANSQNRSIHLRDKFLGDKNCLENAVVTGFSAWSRNIFILSNNIYSGNCHLQGEHYICNMSTTVLYYEPKSVWMTFGYTCDEKKNLFGLQFAYTTKSQNTTECERLEQQNTKDSNFQCDQFYNFVAFPNAFGRTSQSDALQLLHALRAAINENEHCYKHLDYALCQILFPRCPDGTTENNNVVSHLTVICEDMCQEILDACSETFGTIVNYIECSYYTRTFENDTQCIHLPVTCEPPPSVEDGHITDASNKTHNVGSVVEYYCDDNYKIVGNATSQCQYSGTWTPRPVCKSLVYIHLTIAGVSLAIIFMLIIAIIAVVRKQRKARNVKEKPIQKRNREFDVFVSYTYTGSIDFVKNVVHPKLELEPNPPFKIFCHTRDFHAATLIYQNILDGVKKSNCGIVLMTQEYIDSSWCREEFQVSRYNKSFVNHFAHF